MSGGYYKYHCKYWWTLNCENWVYVNGSPCAKCCAEGRENEQLSATIDPWRVSNDVSVPRMEGGAIHYTLMEIINQSESSNERLVRHKARIPTMSLDTSPQVTRTSPDVPALATNF
ncbi:hypothetical protein Micbo1qcDRAFT_156228 [Microdochium bolleyi]|uniref:Uncharacterized protein n=1 Tax=Microdochium bolleyi TaxID=196109 RepID=A0A136JJP5_9PEZI|nr:hypothetical protein Micbo1qcDRAFT_156228 [Microdochium bolleyi]